MPFKCMWYLKRLCKICSLQLLSPAKIKELRGKLLQWQMMHPPDDASTWPISNENNSQGASLASPPRIFQTPSLNTPVSTLCHSAERKKNPLTLLKHSPAANGWDTRDKQVWQLNMNWQQLWIHITVWRLFTYYEKQKIHFWKWLGLIADYCFFSDMSHLFCSHFVQSYTDNVQYNSQASCASCADFTWYESVMM